ncbi:hypothetical protein HYH03_011140 [Edaphochlamys debaryana]|uniref:Condensin-2 complex subunit H2 n=1 Tax=Edaphochlamys debaryana TaxID=47281 RepID=A0A835Y3S4_9CHLO|nr:hypothetical protein HYH03_011140 [Edaphochlamys debaryana]|eukprot:KAG2490519.1 hypothetical protein HYH03_011140 [Edaphochlamys debaryana]
MADFDEDLQIEKEFRFAHLLRPIRDLQDNFNIDLAHELEEYLDQLENAQFSLEGAGMVDFAEAALLIQGSTCVYSKKVEYLYNLVYQALEAVKGRKQKQAGVGPDGQPLDGDDTQAPVAGARGRGAAARRGGGDEDEDDGLERFWDVEPLLKDCAADIDLALTDGLLPPTNTSNRPPAALLALEDHGQGATASAAAGKGDGDSGVYRLQQCVVHCSGALLLDARDGDLYDHELRFVGPQPAGGDRGLAAMLQAAQAELHPQVLEPMQPGATAQGPGQANTADGAAAEEPGAAAPATADGDGQAGAAGAEGATGMDLDPGQGVPPGPADGPGAGAMDDDDGGGFDAGGGGWSDDEGAPPLQEQQEQEGAVGAGGAEGMAVDGGAAAAAEGAEGPAAGRRARAAAAAGADGGRVGVADGGVQGEEAGAEEEEFDPYAPLDPGAKGRLADRPLVVRKPRRARRATPHAPGLAPLLAPGLNLGSLSAPAASSSHHPHHQPPPASLLLPEFDYYLPLLRAAAGRGRKEAKEAARRAAEERQRLAAPAAVFDARDAAAAVALDEAAEAEAAAAEAKPPGGQAPPAGDAYGFGDEPPANDVDDGYDGGYDAGGGGSDLDDDVDPTAAVHGDGPSWLTGGEEAGRWPGGGVPAMGPLGEGMAVDAEGDQSYEELCRAHMESMMRAAAAREVQSDLARRVGSWRQRIDPVLQAEESRPQFDIQDYGERIIGRLEGIKVAAEEPLPALPPLDPSADARAAEGAVVFSRVAAGLAPFEISRLFSAMLQLINNRNVEILKADSRAAPAGDVPPEPFALKLLSADMYHKTMGERLAVGTQGGMQAGAVDEDDGEENRGGTQTQAGPSQRGGKGGAARGGGKAGAAKRPKKAALVDANDG